jgi:hypothetical protein
MGVNGTAIILTCSTEYARNVTMIKIDVEPTAEAIEQAAAHYDYLAAQLRSIATTMRDRTDLSYAADAVSAIVQSPMQARIDLIASRPVRALEQHMRDNIHMNMGDPLLWTTTMTE